MAQSKDMTLVQRCASYTLAGIQVGQIVALKAAIEATEAGVQ